MVCNPVPCHLDTSAVFSIMFPRICFPVSTEPLIFSTEVFWSTYLDGVSMPVVKVPYITIPVITTSMIPAFFDMHLMPQVTIVKSSQYDEMTYPNSFV